jgi:hypothetical protein
MLTTKPTTANSASDLLAQCLRALPRIVTTGYDNWCVSLISILLPRGVVGCTPREERRRLASMRYLRLARSLLDRENARQHSARSWLDDAYRILPGKAR